ncbi:MAG: SUMF1/EgtB/PvdO family nonheme iron enzyme [Fibrobacter sp.]|nr:SUMF1/EgtB/PvdO family nonheme iron enzyme [Fibrobacter sp.]
MKLKFAYLFFILSVILGITACSDDYEGREFLFDRTILEMFVLRECPSGSGDTSCYQLRFRHPIETENLVRYHLWLDTTVVDDTSKAVSSSDLEHSIKIEYVQGSTDPYVTYDLTKDVKPFLTWDSLQVALWAEYKDGNEPGSVQRLFLHFGDNLAPSTVTVQDSAWATGVVLDWSRPTDQRDFYEPSDISGAIVGYNIVFWAADTTEDIRNLKVRLEWDGGRADDLGVTGYRRHARFRANSDSVWLDTTSSSADSKNYLRLAVIDGKGFNTEQPELNAFRMTIEGLSPTHRYTVGVIAWDSAGNSSPGNREVEKNQLIITTDKIAPLMPTAVFAKSDSLFPERLALDSNRLVLFWSRSVDPLQEDHRIQVDSVLTIPRTCTERFCYREVQSYSLESWNGVSWNAVDSAGGNVGEKYTQRYAFDGSEMTPAATGTFISDTIRWVAPGDSVILRIRSRDSSGYYSVALIDTLRASFGSEYDLNCPPEFVPVRTDDSTRFCVERFEHRKTGGVFETNVLFAEAQAACEAVSAAGFTVSLCGEKQWQGACLSGSWQTAYGVIEETGFSAAEFLFRNCNVGTNDSAEAVNVSSRNSKCVSPFGVHDFPGNLQEWVVSDSGDGLLKGSSYVYFNGIDPANHALCVTRSYPYRSRAAYTKDSVFLYQNGVRVDTLFVMDTTRTLFRILTPKDFKDTILVFNVLHPETGAVLGEDYVPLAEYRRGGDAWLASISAGFTYREIRREAVFLTGGSVQYRAAAAFFRNPSIGFRCCAFPE